MKNESIKSMKLWILITGFLSLLFYFLHDFIGAKYYPGYNWMAQAVSDLTAVDSASFVVAGNYSCLHGVFASVCVAFLCVIAKEIWKKENEKLLRLGIYLFCIMKWISTIGYSLFPLSGSGYDGSLQSFVHVYVITVFVVLLSIISLIVTVIGGFKSSNKVLAWISLAAFLLMFLGAAGSAAVPKGYFGVVERLSTYSVVIYQFLLGMLCFRKE